MAPIDNTLSIPDEDLPTWIRQSRRPLVDWGVLLVIGLSVLAAWPFILQDGLPDHNNSERYVFMTADYAQAFREGVLYPRWTAAALMGYGAPIPNYYPPGAPYFAAMIDVLFVDDPVVAVRWVYVMALGLAGGVTYALVMRYFGAKAGILASLLYVYSPYLGITAPHVMGDLSGVLGLALLPTLLWAVMRLLWLNRQFDFMLVVLAMAALILTHSQIAFAGIWLAVGLIIWWWNLHKNQHERVFRLGQLTLALGAGVALSAFFWMPALLEQDAIRWQPAPFIRFSDHLTLAALVGPLSRVDLNALTWQPQLTMGMPLLLFAGFGGLILLVKRDGRGFYGWFMLSGLALIGLGVFYQPGATWLLGVITLCFALAGSHAIHLQDWLPPLYRRLALTIMIFLIAVLAIPVWVAPAWPDLPVSFGAQAQILYEQRGYGVAALPVDADVPVTLNTPLDPNIELISSYQGDNTLRLPQNQLGRGRQANLLAGDTHRDRYLLNTLSQTAFIIQRAYFPGWQATLDGRPLDLTADPDTGLIRLIVPPASNGMLEIWLGPTPVRRTAWVMSWSVLLLLVLDTIRRISRRYGPVYDDIALLDQEDVRLVSMISTGFLVAVLLFGRFDSPYALHARPGHQLDNSIGVRSLTDVGLEMISYELPQTAYRIGNTIDFTLFWRTKRDLVVNYSVEVALREMNQPFLWQQQRPRYPGGYPTGRWLTNRYIKDLHTIPLVQGMVPGQYQIVIRVTHCLPDCLSGTPVNFFDADSQMIGRTLVLPSVITIQDVNQ